MKFTVTQEDINNGIKGNACACPIALSIGRSLKAICSVGDGDVVIDRPSFPSFKLPENAVQFAFQYDNDQKVEPFSFEIPDLKP